MTKRTKRNRKQLRIKKDTVRKLDRNELRNIGGGDSEFIAPTNECTRGVCSFMSCFCAAE